MVSQFNHKQTQKWCTTCTQPVAQSRAIPKEPLGQLGISSLGIHMQRMLGVNVGSIVRFIPVQSAAGMPTWLYGSCDSLHNAQLSWLCISTIKVAAACLVPLRLRVERKSHPCHSRQDWLLCMSSKMLYSICQKRQKAMADCCASVLLNHNLNLNVSIFLLKDFSFLRDLYITLINLQHPVALSKPAA